MNLYYLSHCFNSLYRLIDCLIQIFFRIDFVFVLTYVVKFEILDGFQGKCIFNTDRGVTPDEVVPVQLGHHHLLVLGLERNDCIMSTIKLIIKFLRAQYL